MRSPLPFERRRAWVSGMPRSLIRIKRRITIKKNAHSLRVGRVIPNAPLRARFDPQPLRSLRQAHIWQDIEPYLPQSAFDRILHMPPLKL